MKPRQASFCVWQISAALMLCCLLGLAPHVQAAVEALSQGNTALHRGIWQVELSAKEKPAKPFLGVEVKVIFTRPDKSQVTVDAFYRGDSAWIARAYCDTKGIWQWKCLSDLKSLNSKSGSFEVLSSSLPGKLRQHPHDPHQFAYDNGAWFLHIGDTGYRYLVDTEPLWQQYIDEAAQTGFTKIRTWFCRGRGDIQAVFTQDRQGMDLAYWQEMEKRLLYAFHKYPQIQFQVIVYGEDTDELKRYAQSDAMSQYVARYAQARFSAFPNVQWCISNDRDITDKKGKRSLPAQVIEQIGHDMRAREPWRTLLTNHQRRFQGYSFVGSDWSDIITLEDRNQVNGEVVGKYVAQGNDPVVLDEDRYGIYISPAHDRYYFRRLMWANLLSGGQATYGGLDTYLPFEGTNQTKGVQGYITAVKNGLLDDGAHDFRYIHQFFHNTHLNLAGFKPAAELAVNARHINLMADGKNIIAYLANPDGDAPEKTDVSGSNATCSLKLPSGMWQLRWYDPRSGKWHETKASLNGGDTNELTAPFPGDAVLLLTR